MATYYTISFREVITWIATQAVVLIISSSAFRIDLNTNLEVNIIVVAGIAFETSFVLLTYG